MSLLKKTVGLAACAVLMTTSSLALAANAKVITPIRGTIDSITSNDLVLTARNGQKMEFELNGSTHIVQATQAKPSELKDNSYIGTAAVPQAGGKLRALEVHVFAPSLRGEGEGFNPFQSADGKVNTMTNGSVGRLVKGNDGARTLTVQYQGNQQKTVIVPPDVPIVYLQPGDRSLLKAGAKVVLFAKESADHHQEVVNIVAGKNGVNPPM